MTILRHPNYDITFLMAVDASDVGTQEIRFGRKTNEIAKFSILDEKNEIHNFGRNLDEIGHLSPNLTPSVIEVRRKGV